MAGQVIPLKLLKDNADTFLEWGTKMTAEGCIIISKDEEGSESHINRKKLGIIMLQVKKENIDQVLLTHSLVMVAFASFKLITGHINFGSRLHGWCASA